MDALKVRVSPKIGNFAVLNQEEQSGVPSVLDVLEAAFKRIDAFGLRVEFLEKDHETQSLYTVTLSAFRFKVIQAAAHNMSDFPAKTIIKEQEFSNTKPHYMRGTLICDLKQNLKSNQICQGWFSVLLTKQRSINASQVVSPFEDVNFLAIYQVNVDKPLGKMIQLKGLYPSMNISSGC